MLFALIQLRQPLADLFTQLRQLDFTNPGLMRFQRQTQGFADDFAGIVCRPPSTFAFTRTPAPASRKRPLGLSKKL